MQRFVWSSGRHVNIHRPYSTISYDYNRIQCGENKQICGLCCRNTIILATSYHFDNFTGAGLLSRSRVTRVGSWNLCRDEAGDRGTIYEFPDIIWFMLNQTGANSGRREYTEQQGSGAGLQSALSSDILTRWSTVARSSYVAIRSKFTF